MSVGRPRWTSPSTCSIACWTWDARAPSASPDPDGVGGSAAAPMIRAPRCTVLNAFLNDVYGAQECIKAGVIPADLVYRNPHYRIEMLRFPVPHNIYVHIAGIDVVRVDEDTFYVLEDNVRTPSGVSYMLENREVMMRLFPELFTLHRVAPVEDYPESLL